MKRKYYVKAEVDIEFTANNEEDAIKELIAMINERDASFFDYTVHLVNDKREVSTILRDAMKKREQLDKELKQK